MSKVIIFGASGDLAKRKIMPALSKIYNKSMEIYGYARSDLEKTYSQEMRNFYDYSDNDDTENFPDKVVYIKGEYGDLSPLSNIIDENTVAYLSLPPKVYRIVLAELYKYKVRRIAIEKPYGTCIDSFNELLKFKNDNTSFIDHYLLKPIVISISRINSKNSNIFNFLNNGNIKSIECLFLETLLVEGRAYFDATGIIKDVMQNHLVEALASILCEHSNEVNDKSRIKLIKSMKIDSKKYIFGQYKSYKEEIGRESGIETFAAFKCFINDIKWEGTPILMAGGKGLKTKRTEIIFNIRNTSYDCVSDIICDTNDRAKFNSLKGCITSLSLIFNISPKNEIYLNINDGNEKIILFTNDEIMGMMKYKIDGNQDYKLLLNQLILDEYLPTVSFEEADLLWKLFEGILSAPKPLKYYEIGVEMPDEAIDFFNNNK